MLTTDQIIGRLREKGKREKDIQTKLGAKWPSHVNNVIHKRCIKGKKVKQIRSVIAEFTELPYAFVWGNDE